MNHLGTSLRSGLVVLLAAVAIVAGAASPASAATAQYSGTLADGATWTAEVPDNWNGIVILASHGFGPPAIPPFGHLPPPVQNALLERGYAVAGSSYDPNGSWWALKSAVRDQFATIDAFTAAVGEEPERVLALGTSMGGLVSALEAEQTQGDIDGALTTCGIVAGAIDLNNYQLDAEYVISKLLAPLPIQLVNFPTIPGGFTSGAALTAAAQAAQTTPEGRARLSLALAFLNAPPAPAPAGQPIPTMNDPEAFEAAQYNGYFGGPFSVMVFIQAARPWIEVSAGGNGSWTLGEDFKSLLDHSPYARVVRALYKKAGLDLKADLETLTAGANIPADPLAIASLQQTSVPTGELKVPELNLHTLYDHLVPVEQENEYRAIVRKAGKNSLLRQAYSDSIGHCNFTPAEIVAGVEALRYRVETGRWASVAEPQKLEALANGLGLGDAAFVQYQPPALSGDNGPFDPSRNALSAG